MTLAAHLLRHSALGVVATAVAWPVAAAETIESEHYALEVETVATVEHPWGLAFLPDGSFLVTERNAGNVRIGREDGTLSEPLEGVPEVYRFEGDTDRSQGGLLHIALHPDFEENSFVYFSFSEPSEEGAGTAIARAVLTEEEGLVRLADTTTIYTMEPHDSGGLHFGGRFAFEPETNAIVLSIGDRRNMSRAQDGEDHAGSFIRILDDGATPDDNPYLDDDEVDDLIFAKGNRNSQAMAFHPETGELWAADHGPLGGDEINLIEGGSNYGWPFQTAGEDYSGAPLGEGAEVEGMASPIHVFEETVAPSGLAFYEGEVFPEWEGDMLIGGLAAEGLVRVQMEDGAVAATELLLEGEGYRVRDVVIAEDGAVWLLTDHEDGEILRLSAATDDGAADGAG